MESGTLLSKEVPGPAWIRVVVAEDSPVARRPIVDELAGIDGVTVVGHAQDGRHAVELVRDLDPDVVLLDLLMPELDGIEALVQIRSFSDVGIILLTGSRLETEVMESAARKKGADAFLRKPGSSAVDVDRVRAGLDSAMRRLAQARHHP